MMTFESTVSFTTLGAMFLPSASNSALNLSSSAAWGTQCKSDHGALTCYGRILLCPKLKNRSTSRIQKHLSMLSYYDSVASGFLKFFFEKGDERRTASAASLAALNLLDLC